MKKIFLILVAAFAVIFVSSCSDNDNIIENTSKAPIVNTPEGANQGEIMVKFKSEVIEQIEQAVSKTRGGAATRSGLSSVDEVLELIGTYKLERIFPVDTRNESRTREVGLHLWYVLHFDKDTDLQEVAEKLANTDCVVKIEFSHHIERSYDAKQKATLLSNHAKQMMMNRTRSTGNSVITDPGLKLQWGYINDGTAITADMESKHGDKLVPATPGMDVNCAEAWQLCTGDPTIIVAVLDEGVKYDHPDLAANMWVNEGEVFGSRDDADGNGYAGDKYGYNFVDNVGFISYDGLSDTGHGTHVAGTIAAVNNNGIGVSGIAGGDGNPNSGVKIMNCQVFSGEKGVALYQEAQAIKYAADNGAVVLQCSWGYNSGKSNPATYTPGFTVDKDWVAGCPLEKEALDYFIHNAGSPNGVIEGGIAVFAGGNEYAPMAGYPGAYPDYVSVASIAADGTPSSFSNFGPGITLSAPGGDSDYHMSEIGKIYSTVPPELYNGESYGYLEGTSMACPHVSGVVALALSYAAKQHRHYRADDFKKLIYESCHSLDQYYNDLETKNYWLNYDLVGQVAPYQMELNTYKGKMGAGLIDAGALLKAVANGGVEITVPNAYVGVGKTMEVDFSKYFKNGKTVSYTCKVDDSLIAKIEAKAAGDSRIFTITGLRVGSTKVSVTSSDNRTQEFYITVRKNANGSGWL